MLATEIDIPSILDRVNGVKVLVIGDIMLDVYRIGYVSRISPEAPVPVLLNAWTEYRLGGAAAVAAMCAALGAQVTLIGVIGQDRSGLTVRTLCPPAGIHLQAIIDTSRPTATKERICAIASGHRQQLGRLDREEINPLNKETETLIQAVIHDQLTTCPDIVILSDYGKGLATERIINQLRPCADRTIVDPPKDNDWFDDYTGFGCLVPNRREAGGYHAKQLQQHLDTDAVIVKLDEHGCTVATRDGTGAHIPAEVRAVHDVTGAGDQFIAMLGCARAAGLDWEAAARMANTAAGLQVERHGCVPVTADELITS